MMKMSNDLLDFSSTPDYGAISSIQISELVDIGVININDGTWNWDKYSDEQDKNLKESILAHFWYREIGIVPFKVWKHEFLRKMNEIMPKYVQVYKIIAEEPERFGAESTYNKSRNITSDYPQSQLQGNYDYASYGNDIEGQRVRGSDVIDLMTRLKTYDDVNKQICEEMETLFSPFFSVGF